MILDSNNNYNNNNYYSYRWDSNSYLQWLKKRLSALQAKQDKKWYKE